MRDRLALKGAPGGADMYQKTFRSAIPWGQRAPSPPTGHGGEGSAPAEAIAPARQVARKRTIFRGSTLLTKEFTVLGGQILP
jgi:hypothetical protein